MLKSIKYSIVWLYKKYKNLQFRFCVCLSYHISHVSEIKCSEKMFTGLHDNVTWGDKLGNNLSDVVLVQKVTYIQDIHGTSFIYGNTLCIANTAYF